MSTLQITSADEVLREVDEFFMKTGPVYEALHKLAERLSREGIDYALIGGMARVARFRAAYTRYRSDYDARRTGEIREEIVSGGYVPAFPGARKQFRDSETGVTRSNHHWRIPSGRGRIDPNELHERALLEVS